MLTLVLRRAYVQRRLLTAVVLLVAPAATLVGVCALMLGATADRAFSVEVRRAPPADLGVTAFLVEVAGDDVPAARAEAAAVVEDVLAPMRPSLDVTATSRLRRLDGDDGRLAYLTGTDALPARADLVAGRWPTAATIGAGGGNGAGPDAVLEAAVPATTARLLGLAPGDEVVLGREVGLDGSDVPVTVAVVGTFRPRADVEWERDPLAGAGFAAAYSDGLEAAPTYGPFVLREAAFAASGSFAKGLRVTGHPRRALAGDEPLRAAAGSLGDASRRLASGVGDRARITRLASDLPTTLERVHAQQASTRATVVVVLLLGTALSLAAALLAGWLVAAVREDEQDLLRAMGLDRRQQVGAATLEALLLACLAAAVAVPVAAVVHSRLTHLPDLRAAGLEQPPTVSALLLLSVLGAAVALTMALVATSAGTARGPDPVSRPGVLVRLGLAPLLLLVAVAAWWQLRSQPATAARPGDVTLALAPVVFVAASTALAVRVVPVLLGWAARVGIRSRSFVLPLAAQQAARRRHTGTAMVLVAAAAACAVFGVALRTTWQQSQEDQAALRVGTDVALALPAPAGLQEAREVAAAVPDGSPDPVVSPVIHRPLALGRYVGQEGRRPVLVAVDTRHAGALLRGRTEPGWDWAGVGEALAPEGSVAGVSLPEDGEGVRLRGRSPRGAALTVAPTAVVEDPSGFRASVGARPLALDGRPHPLEWTSPLGSGLRLVGLRLELDGDPGAAPSTDADVEVVVTVPAAGDGLDDGPAWQLLPLQQDSPVAGAAVSVEPTGAGTELRASLGINLAYYAYTGADVLASAFPTPPHVPVVVSQDLVDAVGARVGDELSALVGDAVLLLRVTAVVPTVPSAPGQVAVLADADMLSRALIDVGRLDPVVDGWWVGRPPAATAPALRSLGLGEVTVRQDVADQLAQGPLRVTVPTTLLALVAVAVVMLAAAVGLVRSAERQRRSSEVVRLRALGLSRRDARRLLVAEHLAFFVPLVLVGTLVGLLAAVSLGPHLVRSDLGAAPVPAAVATWSWATELLLVGGLVLVTLVLTAGLAAAHVRRSDPAQLRAGDL
ncbi:FtsX-like permease family protein [Nocardioides sp. zg-1308]|uniref:FtsX-like permease family protein n=1 Tax=Nocardioides sp. zg-1308 TaxID=2736253 RepID=UPI0015532301|nr:FtsX-like permease family protein [Nocardioides sp. zg-1308]